MQVFKDFFAKKTIGYYLGLVAAILLVFVGIFYGVTYAAETAYYNAIVWLLAVVGGLGYIGLSCFDITAPFAPIAVGWGALGTFVAHLRYVYMYFTNIFFNGVTMDALLSMNFTVVLTIIGPIVCLILAIISFFTKPLKKEAKNEE